MNRFELLDTAEDDDGEFTKIHERSRSPKKKASKRKEIERLQGRDWLYSSKFHQLLDSAPKFRAVTYNVLAPSYTKKKYVPCVKTSIPEIC
jgi:hypothetical protein